MKWRLVLGVAALAVIGGAALFYYYASTPDSTPFSPNPAFSEPLKPLTIGDFTVQVAIADTSSERTMGLSDTKALVEGTGLFFVFESESRPGFWMKDMLFPIDIIWISAAGAVVGLEENVSPETFPTIFRPSEDVRYVLEVPAGFSAAHNIEKSAKVSVEMVL